MTSIGAITIQPCNILNQPTITMYVRRRHQRQSHRRLTLDRKHVRLPVEIGLTGEDPCPASAEVIQGGLGEQLEGIQTGEVLRVSKGSGRQGLQNRVHDVKDLGDDGMVNNFNIKSLS